MVFTSSIFIFIFLPVTLLIYFLACLVQKGREKEAIPGRIQPKNMALFFCSVVFYAWGGIKYALLLLFSAFVNYEIGRFLGKTKGKQKKLVLTVGVFWNLGLLFWFKYMNWIVPSLKIVLPIGISFFTFQIMSYLFDVYYETVPVQESFTDLGLYIMLFPQLIAGPIVRYSDVNNEIGCRKSSFDDIHGGILRFMTGFSKKIFLANAMGVIADASFKAVDWLNTGHAWLGLLSYSLQIYLDFSAYSDMAIGLGRIFGFHFLENFNYPYISQSVQEFWRRWHISLSTWFRDYVYIPLGGSRKGTERTYLNLMIVFLLTGIWHGASWNFVLWGIYFGILLILERIFLGGILKKIPAVFRHVYTLIAVFLGWVLFRADDLTAAAKYYKALFSFDFTNYGTFSIMEHIDKEYVLMLIISLIVCLPVGKTVREKIRGKEAAELTCDLMTVGVFLLAVLYMVGTNFNPFIYFRF